VKKSFGCVEYRSVARGVLAEDAMLKKGRVELISALTLCPGKFIIMISGDVESVREAVEAGGSLDPEFAISGFVLPNLHPSVIPSLTGTCAAVPEGAMAFVEGLDVCCTIAAADAAAKAAGVTLLETRIARGMGGKSIIWMCGRLAAVEVSAAAACGVLADAGFLLASAVLPAPHPGLSF
jgi:microcompartment protein CcmL/EutN